MTLALCNSMWGDSQKHKSTVSALKKPLLGKENNRKKSYNFFYYFIIKDSKHGSCSERKQMQDLVNKMPS